METNNSTTFAPMLATMEQVGKLVEEDHHSRKRKLVTSPRYGHWEQNEVLALIKCN